MCAAFSSHQQAYTKMLPVGQQVQQCTDQQADHLANKQHREHSKISSTGHMVMQQESVFGP